jgi:hypothetical protein
MLEWIEIDSDASNLPDEKTRCLVASGNIILGEAFLRRMHIIERQDAELVSYGTSEFKIIWLAQTHGYRHNSIINIPVALYWDNVTHYIPFPLPPTKK